jgi:hypothetical protein
MVYKRCVGWVWFGYLTAVKYYGVFVNKMEVLKCRYELQF